MGSSEGRLIIVGCGGHARSVADVALTAASWRIVFVDSNAKPDESIFDHPVVASIEWCPGDRVIIAIGDNIQRARHFAEVEPGKLATIVSPRAYVGRYASLGAGTFVAHGAHIGPEARVGQNSIINTAAVVEHEASIGEHSHVAPHGTVAGRARLGARVLVGVGATVIDGVSVCDDCVIGAGATVVSDLVARGTYVGVPARKLR